MITPEILSDLADLDLTPEQFKSVMKIMAKMEAAGRQSADEIVRTYERRRKRRGRITSDAVVPENVRDIVPESVPESVRDKEKSPPIPPSKETTSSETKVSSEVSCAVAPATRTGQPDRFDEFWRSYPKREGANPKEPARKAFIAALKAGAEADEIIAGSRQCAERDADKIGTPYIPQAVKWLRDKRWQDYAPVSDTGPPEPMPPDPSLPSDHELRNRYAQADNPESGAGILRARRGDDEGDARHERQQIPDDRARHAGIRSMAAVLRSSPGMASLVVQGAVRREDRGDDGPDSMATVV